MIPYFNLTYIKENQKTENQSVVFFAEEQNVEIIEGESLLFLDELERQIGTLRVFEALTSMRVYGDYLHIKLNEKIKLKSLYQSYPRRKFIGFAIGDDDRVWKFHPEGELVEKSTFMGIDEGGMGDFFVTEIWFLGNSDRIIRDKDGWKATGFGDGVWKGQSHRLRSGPVLAIGSQVKWVKGDK